MYNCRAVKCLNVYSYLFDKLQFICLIGGRVCNPRQQHVVDIQSILLLPRVTNPPPNVFNKLLFV